MFKISRILLLVFTALFLLGISTNAFAAKPPQSHTAASGVLFHAQFYCTLVNVSDHEIEATITVYPLNTYVPPNPVEEPQTVVEIVPIGGYLIGGNSTANADFAYCEVEWIGKPGDIRATFCSAAHCSEVR